ncbi:hypothetical protein GCM10010116_15640 [Microbispora rosea subsp. aerata]|nr:hypothetical protein GCM10010116_15640 [Microbispora rosea subsp. aerata]GIH53263.1 hypothetical protein Mro02_01770 [Microbispora rosea subsp. aerata]GLJ83824.1 hypothetical protein GCM10017588_25520 [Microbispora rosea subsp. aerata]
MASPAANIALYRIFHLRALVPRPYPEGLSLSNSSGCAPAGAGSRRPSGALCRTPIKTRRLADGFDVTGTPQSALI